MKKGNNIDDTVNSNSNYNDNNKCNKQTSPMIMATAVQIIKTTISSIRKLI